MTARKMYFIGLLQNVDSSILNVKLENNFKFNSIPEKEGGLLFSALENLPFEHIVRKLFMDYHCLEPKLKQYFFVENSFDLSGDELLSLQKLLKFNGSVFSKLSKLDGLVHSYLYPTLRLMRLFKEGSIGMPLRYYFYMDRKNKPHSSMRGWTHIYQPPGPIYSLKEDEIDQLQKFLKDTRMPFKDYIQLAFENFELSYGVHPTNVAFLSLINGLEALFNPGGGEIRYRLSRNCAVLLGNDKQEATEIYKNVKRFYSLRSSIVHSSKKINVEREELIKLRDYLRESIKNALRINKSKEEMLDILNAKGFGEL